MHKLKYNKVCKFKELIMNEYFNIFKNFISTKFFTLLNSNLNLNFNYL